MVCGNANRLHANESKSTNAGNENNFTILYQNVVGCVFWSSFLSLVSQYEGLKLVCHMSV